MNREGLGSMNTRICSAAPQIGVIMVVCSRHGALAADQLPREIVGNWCLAFERTLPQTKYAYRRCKDSSSDIIVRLDGFEAQETSCELNKIKRQGAVWLARFGCSGTGLRWWRMTKFEVARRAGRWRPRSRTHVAVGNAIWPAPGSEDTKLGVLMELEVGHGATKVYAGVQA